MFATYARRLRFVPKDGMKVIARGHVGVYEPTGQYQLYIEDLQPDGVGALNLAFEQLKEKLGCGRTFSRRPQKVAASLSDAHRGDYLPDRRGRTPIWSRFWRGGGRWRKSSFARFGTGGGGCARRWLMPFGG